MTQPNDSAHPNDTYVEEGYLVSGGGLSKREHFAALALQGLLTKYSLKAPEDQEIVCQMAVELSDTLIKTLNK